MLLVDRVDGTAASGLHHAKERVSYISCIAMMGPSAILCTVRKEDPVFDRTLLILFPLLGLPLRMRRFSFF